MKARDQWSGRLMDADEIIEYYAINYSINPKLLLALIEYQTGALSNHQRNKASEEAFGFSNQHKGVANFLRCEFV